MITLKVKFENGDYFYTGFNGTRETAESYYLGKRFNIGSAEDNMQKCVAIEFLEEEDDDKKRV